MKLLATNALHGMGNEGATAIEVINRHTNICSFFLFAEESVVVFPFRNTGWVFIFKV